jgi:hypothetical protein
VFLPGFQKSNVSTRISRGQGIFSREIKGHRAFSVKIGHFALCQIKTEKFT